MTKPDRAHALSGLSMCRSPIQKRDSVDKKNNELGMPMPSCICANTLVCACAFGLRNFLLVPLAIKKVISVGIKKNKPNDMRKKRMPRSASMLVQSDQVGQSLLATLLHREAQNVYATSQSVISSVAPYNLIPCCRTSNKALFADSI